MNLEFTRAPHRGRQDVAVQQNAALLIDFDNVTMGIRSNLGQELRTLLDSDVIRGKVAVQRAYADWRRYPQYIVPLSESSIDLIFAPAYGSSKKNATDIRLAIDALELVFTRPEIGTFILLSGDSDFSSLVLKLKEYGKYVIGVGLQESTSDILVQNCDEYYSYNRLSGLMSADEQGAEKHDPWTLVGRAVTRMVDRDDVMRSDRLKQVMLEIDPSFDEKTAGFNKFNRFLAEAAHKDLVRLRKGENGQYEVAPGDAAGGADRSASAPQETAARSETSSRSQSGRGRRGRRGGSRSSRSSDSGGRGSGDSGGRGSRAGEAKETPAPDRREAEGSKAADAAADSFEGEVPAVALRKAYDELAAVVDLLYDGEPIRDSMAKRKLLERDETFDEGSLGFRKFSRFLRQAHDEGIIDLTQGDEGNYYLRPVRGEDAHPSRRKERDRGDRDGGRARESRGGEAPAAPEERPSAPTAAASAPPRSPEKDEEQESALAAAKAAAKRTLGRFRRGSKSQSPQGGSGTESRIGPVETGDEDATDAAADAAEAETPEREPVEASAGATSPEGGETGKRSEPAEPSRARGLGRYRSGSRGRSGSSRPSGSASVASRIGPVDMPGDDDAGSDGTGGGPGDDGASGPAAGARQPAPDATAAPPAGESGGVVDHMIRNYPGVGKRTAEALVDHFGPDLFEVIDREPDRLTEAISEGRARAVIEARKEERED